MDIQVKAGLSMPSIAEALQKCRGELLLIHYHTTLFSYPFRKCGKNVAHLGHYRKPKMPLSYLRGIFLRCLAEV